VANDQVTIKQFAFQAPAIRVTVGTTVRWSNDDDSAHTVTADANQEAVAPQPVFAFDSGLMPKGANFSTTFTQPGTYTYHCNLHLGMAGSVVVTPANVLAAFSSTTQGAPDLQAAVADSLGQQALRVPGTTIDPTGDATVVYALRNTASSVEGLRSDARADILAVLAATYQSADAPRIRTVTVLGTYATPDEPRPEVVMRATLSADRARSLRWDHLQADQLASVLDEWWEHPGLTTGDTLPSAATDVAAAADTSAVSTTDVRGRIELMLVHLNEVLYALEQRDRSMAAAAMGHFSGRWTEAADSIEALYAGPYATLDADRQVAEGMLARADAPTVDGAANAVRELRDRLLDLDFDLR
jgi:plastocyanin